MVIGSAAEEDSPRFSRNVAEKMLARVPRERRVMRKGGVEPPTAFRLPDPKSGASASSATFALRLLEPNGQQSSVTRRPRTDDRVPMTDLDVALRSSALDLRSSILEPRFDHILSRPPHPI